MFDSFNSNSIRLWFNVDCSCLYLICISFAGFFHTTYVSYIFANRYLQLPKCWCVSSRPGCRLSHASPWNSFQVAPSEPWAVEAGNFHSWHLICQKKTSELSRKPSWYVFHVNFSGVYHAVIWSSCKLHSITDALSLSLLLYFLTVVSHPWSNSCTLIPAQVL